MGFVVSSFVRVEASTTVNYDIDGIFDTGGSWDGLSGTGTRGNTLSLDVSSKPAGHNFAFWIINGVVRKDLAVDHEYVFTSVNVLQAVFTPTGKVAAVFIDSNGRYLGVKYTEGGAVVDTGLTNTPAARPGFVVSSSSKWTSIEGSASISDVQENSVFVLTYEEAETPLGALTLSVTGGSSSVANPVPFNSLVTVTADVAPEGQVFAGWVENYVIVSYNPQYKFSALSSRTLTATYAESSSSQSIITMSFPLTTREGYETFIGQYELIPGQEIIEYGFIYHPTAVKTLTINSAGAVIAQSNNKQGVTNEFITSFPDGTYSSIRAYVYYKQGESNYYKYSALNITLGTLEQLDAPTNLQIGSSTELLTWTAVNNATDYRVYVGTEVYTVVGATQLNLKPLSLDGNKNYEVAVVAIGDGDTYSDSNMSTKSTYQRIRFVDLIISEYIEGAPGNRKAIEIYNGTGNTVNLSIYRLKVGANGVLFNTSATNGYGFANIDLLHGDSFVAYYDDSTLNDKLGPYGDVESTLINFNGDDAVGLFKNNILIDVFGTEGFDPGTGWTIDDIANATVDSVVIRKATILSPSTTWNSNDWTRLGAYVDGTSGSTTLGIHNVTLPITITIPEE